MVSQWVLLVIVAWFLVSGLRMVVASRSCCAASDLGKWRRPQQLWFISAVFFLPSIPGEFRMFTLIFNASMWVY